MPPSLIHTFAFADLVGYTVYTAVHGDEAAADLAIGFAGEADGIASEHGAELVKQIGDAVLLRGTDAGAMVHLGLALSAIHPAAPWCSAVRVGMHTGTAVQRAGDWFGTTVNLAARLVAAAGPGQVLVSEATWRRAAATGCSVTDLGPCRFHNAPEPMGVLAVAA